LVINTTEAMISIDVNSGKATRERNIAETALKTNLEAVVEIARQCCLRDLAGLIVVDLIDMAEKRNNAQVERCLRDALREDKAKIQVGTISNFGLLEFSRQRLRSSIVDANMIVCPHCNGIGFIWSNESVAIQVLRKIEETVAVLRGSEITVTLSLDVAAYLMNHKRLFISNMEERFNLKIIFKIDSSVSVSDFKIEQTMKPLSPEKSEEFTPNIAEKNEIKDAEKPDEEKKKLEEAEKINESGVVSSSAKSERNKRKRKRRRSAENSNVNVSANASEDTEDVGAEVETSQEVVSEVSFDSPDLSNSATENKEEKSVYDSLQDDLNAHKVAIANAARITEVYETFDAILSEKRTIDPAQLKKRKNIWWQRLVKKPK
jgi:ribonuclease E